MAQGAVAGVTATADTPSPEWTGWGYPTEVGLHATATNPTPDTGSTLQGPNWKWTVDKVEYSDDNVTFVVGGVNYCTIQNDTLANATLKCWFYQGAYWRVTCKVTVGYSETPGTKTWTGSATCAPRPNSGELLSITVTSGATQTNVTGAKNWAAIKSAGSTVGIQATYKPNVAAVANLIVWTGGTPVAGDNSQSTVDKGTSARTTVTAAIGDPLAKDLDVWILWVTITVEVAGTTPANAVQFGASYDATENLGGRSYAGGTVAVGKVVPVGTISPAGAGAVVTGGWNFRRDRWFKSFADGVVTPGPGSPNGITDAGWVDDTSFAVFQRLTPDANDKIYDRDAPNVARFGNTTDTQVYANFREYVQWNPTAAETAARTPTTSDYALWYWKGRWQVASAPQITLKDAGTGNIVLPAAAAP